MKLLIAGYIPSTLIDWPGKISSVIFTLGCNFRCSFCHNPELVYLDKNTEAIDPKEFLKYLKSRRKWLDGVVITGGEPTIYKDLPKFIKKIKDAGFDVKLDTNGTNYKMLKELVTKHLIDYVAMDIKAPKKLYKKTVNNDFDIKSIEKCVQFLLKDKIDYEFRTTMVPDLIDKEEMKEIGEWIWGAKRYFLQPFRPGVTLDPDFRNKRTYTKKELDNLLKIAKKYIKNSEIRG